MMRSIADLSRRSTDCASNYGFYRLSCAMALLAISACAHVPEQQQSSTKPMTELLGGRDAYPVEMQVFVEKDVREGARNRALNDVLGGLAALELSHPDLSQRLLGDAREQIEIIYADSPSAEHARSTFVPEASKDFKGDPYERAMVGYYLSLADFVAGDLDNARADLRFAEYQDTMSASETFQSDMVVMPFIRGWLYNCSANGTRAKDEFASVVAAKSQLRLPASDDNVLLLAEVGRAPEKYATGKYREELRYRRGGASTVRGVSFVQGSRLVVGQQIEDVYFQASTRGGRAVDKILAGKASFKNVAENIAVGAAIFTDISSDLATNSMMYGDDKNSSEYAGLALLGAIVSVGSSMVANAAKPEADTRSWDTLPDRIYIASAHMDKPDANALWSSGFHNEEGTLLRANRMKLFKSGSCMLAWAREKPVLSSDNWTDSSKEHRATVDKVCGEKCESVMKQIELDASAFPIPAVSSDTGPSSFTPSAGAPRLVPAQPYVERRRRWIFTTH